MAETKTKTPATPEQKMRRKASRLIGYTAWIQGYKAANPGASKENRKAAWATARKVQTQTGRRTLKALEKNGFTLVQAEAPAKA